MKYRKNVKTLVLLLIFIVYLCGGVSQAAPPPLPPLGNNPRNQGDEELQLQKSRQQAQERQERQNQRDVLLQTQKSQKDESLPQEAPAFLVKQVILTGEDAVRFGWLQKQASHYNQRKIGQKGLELIVKRLGNLLIDRGYITTRLIIPDQDISKGILNIQIVGGYIGDIRFAEENSRADWQSAFPVRPGDLLNLRDLEQGLEQLKRVQSQEADFQLVPGEKPGFSDIVIKLKRSRPDKLILSLDDSGNKSTGKWQSSYIYSLDNLIGKNDLFRFTYNKDAEGAESQRGTYGKSIYWSLPDGYWTYSFSYRSNNYKQTIPYADIQFVYSGDSETWEEKIERLIQRTQTSKTSISLTLGKNNSHNYIDDNEITIQRKAIASWELAVSHRKYVQKDIWDYQFSYRKGVPWFGAQEDSAQEETSRYRLWTVDINWQKPTSFLGRASRYTMALHGQYTNDRLYASEGLSIGNRYTVRGFDGEQTLIGEKGFYLRNELAIPLNAQGHEIYCGLDYGYVTGPSAVYLTERKLLGGAIGFRGNFGTANLDIFVGCPLIKPTNMKSDSPTFGFQYILQL